MITIWTKDPPRPQGAKPEITRGVLLAIDTQLIVCGNAASKTPPVISVRLEDEADLRHCKTHDILHSDIVVVKKSNENDEDETTMSINPYSHTSYIKNPTVGRKLYADEVHQDMMGIANQFTATPTINKYAHSTESIADIANLPAVACSPFTRSSSMKRDNETINKRKLTTESIYDLHQIPCPFGGQQGNEEHAEGRKRRFFTEESKNDLSMLPDPFQPPRKDRSDYVFDRTYNSRPVQNQSHYAFDYPLPPSPLRYLGTPQNEQRWQERDQKTVNKYVRSAQSQADLQRVPALPHHNYNSYRSPGSVTPTHSSYDYTPYAQPMMPPSAPVYVPLPPIQANPYVLHPPAYAYYPYAHYAPMYHLGPAYYAPYPAPYYPSAQWSEDSDLRTETEHARIPDQFLNNPHQYHLHRPVTPDNETINKHLRGAESIADLHKLDVNFEPKQVQNVPTPVQSNSSGGHRLRDFSVDSIKDLDALPSISQMSLYNTPTRNVLTAKSISDGDVAAHPVAARST